MFQQTFAIILNTFLESIRQPIMLVILCAATLMIIFANPLAAFSMSDDQRMYIDMGLATVFLCGALLAAFIATNVLGREIENRTALTVISKPVSRPVFVIGKYIGVAAALTLATLYMAIVFLLVDRHKVLQTVRDPLHLPVILFGFGAGIIGVGVGVWCNYFYGKVFSSTVICVTTPLAVLAYFFSLLFRPDFSSQSISTSFKPQLWMALGALLIAILVLTAIAVAASTRLGQVLTLCITVGVFIAGMLSDWVFGRPIVRLEQEWSQRARELTEADVQKRLEGDRVDLVRAWVLETRNQQALHMASLWPRTASNEAFKRRAELKFASEAQRGSDIAIINDQAFKKAMAQLAVDQASANALAQDVQWPVAKKDVVFELAWPSIVLRATGETERIDQKRLFVYPPLQRSVSLPSERATHMASRIAYSIVPNFQVMLLSDAVTQGHVIPLEYLGRTAVYGGLYILAALSLATMLFQGREIG